MLSKQDLVHYEIFGFILMKNMLSQKEIQTITSEFEIGLIRAEKQTERQSFRKQLNWWNMGPDTPYLASILEKAKFLDIANQVLNNEAIGSFSSANSFSGNRTDWHPDTQAKHWKGLKFGIYLQSLNENTGALRVIPGSHKEPLHSDFKKIRLKESFDLSEIKTDSEGLDVQEVPAYNTSIELGDVIMFDNHLWHGSYGGSEDRRLITLGYFKNPTTKEEIASANQAVEQEKNARSTFPLLSRHPDWTTNRGNNKTRQFWIDRLKDIGYI